MTTSTTHPTFQYYVPSTSTVYHSYQQLRQAFPAYSLPKNQDIPSLDIFQLWYTEYPVVQEGYHVESGAPEFNPDDGHWYQVYLVVENPPQE